MTERDDRAQARRAAAQAAGTRDAAVAAGTRRGQAVAAGVGRLVPPGLVRRIHAGVCLTVDAAARTATFAVPDVLPTGQLAGVAWGAPWRAPRVGEALPVFVPDAASGLGPWVEPPAAGGYWLYYVDLDGYLARVDWPPTATGWDGAVRGTADLVARVDPTWQWAKLGVLGVMDGGATVVLKDGNSQCYGVAASDLTTARWGPWRPEAPAPTSFAGILAVGPDRVAGWAEEDSPLWDRDVPFTASPGDAAATARGALLDMGRYPSQPTPLGDAIFAAAATGCWQDRAAWVFLWTTGYQFYTATGAGAYTVQAVGEAQNLGSYGAWVQWPGGAVGWDGSAYRLYLPFDMRSGGDGAGSHTHVGPPEGPWVETPCDVVFVCSPDGSQALGATDWWPVTEPGCAYQVSTDGGATWAAWPSAPPGWTQAAYLTADLPSHGCAIVPQEGA